MIIDTSAIIAILDEEPESPAFRKVMEKAESLRMSVVSYVEAYIVLRSVKDPIVLHRLQDLISASFIEIMPVTAEQGRIACDAYRDFGRGSGSKAKLNFGDCFSYALARETREPLLFKGKDFLHTDIKSAT
ncbi:MAG: type II toxin-antitoxin system VapC family toxin [Acidobacteria bacterium]|nr:type II toxin-antitoxin system VapC family toxin [Acidobacteriota bacterium]